jgi:hypothetical protein
MAARRARNHWARGVALGLSLLVFSFVFHGVSHVHQNGQDEAACQTCQAAHVGIYPAVSAPILPTPLLAAGRVQALTLVLADTPVSPDRPSRAPPSVS